MYHLAGIVVGITAYVYLVGVITDEVKEYFWEFVADCRTNLWYNVTKSKMILRGDYHKETR